MGPRSMSTTSDVYQDQASNEGLHSNSRPHLHHRKSAKMLINQYETMHRDDDTRPLDLVRKRANLTHSSHRRSSPSYILLSSSNALRHRSTPVTASNATASASFYPSNKGSSGATAPLRHSFKNLLSLLKKGKNGLMGPSDKEKVIFPTVAAAASKRSATLAEEHKELPLLPIPLDDAQRPELSRSQTQTGTLIFLTTYTPLGLDEDSPISVPLWAPCTIVLRGSTIGVSWFTPEGIPCVRDIALVGCSDIRSVSSDLRSLAPEEREALPGGDEAGGGGDQLKIFELLFKDRRPPERFAVASVRERAKWISAFWDAMLSPSSESTEGKEGGVPADYNDRFEETKVDKREKRQRQPTSQPASSVTRPSPPAPIRTNTERSLPPIPGSRTQSQRQEMPVVPPLSIPSKSGTSLRMTRPMARTETNNTSSTTILLSAPPAKLPMPISPVSAYSTGSATSSRVQSPTRSMQWPPPHAPSTNRGGTIDAALSSTSLPRSPRRWPSLGSDSAASSIASVPSLVRRANSPSITNLSRLSVVKGRLAQLERNQSKSQTSDSEHGTGRASSSRSRSSSKVREGPQALLPEEKVTRRGRVDPSSGGEDRDLEGLHGVDDNAGRLNHFGRESDSGTSPSPVASSNNSARLDSLSKQITPTDGLPVITSPRSEATGAGWAADDEQQKRILEGLASIRAVLGKRGEVGSGDDTTIQRVTLGLDHKLKGANETLKEVKSTLHVIEKRLDNAQKQEISSRLVLPPERQEEIVHLLKAVKAQLAADLPGLEAKIYEISSQQEKIMSSHHRVSASETPLDLGPIQKQLDDLMKLSSSTQVALNSRTTNRDVHSEITRLISLMEGDRAHREQQLLQQADSVRYLNELNTWLGAFVNNGASHIQGLASNIDKLCAELGSTMTTNDGADSSRSASLSLLHDVRQLVLGMKARDQNMASLQAVLNDLITAIGPETRHGADTTALARLMENQKKNQESMLKAFSDEISDEIKGERLRFVEAMKEATAINVQLHVEQLKKEMGKEVFVMAKEVERLHRDKQEVESRIADLMAFYSKQKHPSSHNQNSMPSMQPVADLRMKPLASGGYATSRSHRRQTTYEAVPGRPLPLPRGSY